MAVPLWRLAMRVYSSSKSGGTGAAMRSRSAKAAASNFCFSSCCAWISLRSLETLVSASFKSGFGVAHAALEFFAGHHDVELAVFGFGDFRFGVGDFVQQRLVRFVGFHRAALVAIFARAVFPLVDVEFEFLALFEERWCALPWRRLRQRVRRSGGRRLPERRFG